MRCTSRCGWWGGQCAGAVLCRLAVSIFAIFCVFVWVPTDVFSINRASWIYYVYDSFQRILPNLHYHQLAIRVQSIHHTQPAHSRPAKPTPGGAETALLAAIRVVRTELYITVLLVRGARGLLLRSRNVVWDGQWVP